MKNTYCPFCNTIKNNWRIYNVNKKHQDIFSDLEDDVYQSSLSEVEKQKMLNILSLKQQKINIMITGATGCGKARLLTLCLTWKLQKSVLV